MKKTLNTIILVFLGLYGFSLTGCMTANQLAAEKSYYEAMISMQRQQSAQPIVQILPANAGKPIVFENVASFTVFAPPQSQNGPTLTQYVQKDYVQPWLNVLGMAVPWLGAWGIVKATGDAISSIPHTNSVSNVNSGNTTTTSTATTSTHTNTASGGSVANMGSGSSTLNNISTIEAPVVVTP